MSELERAVLLAILGGWRLGRIGNRDPLLLWCLQARLCQCAIDTRSLAAETANDADERAEGGDKECNA